MSGSSHQWIPFGGSQTPPRQQFDFPGATPELTGPDSAGRLGPHTPLADDLPPRPATPPYLPPTFKTPLRDDSDRAEVKLLKLASAEGRLRDVQQILSQYILSEIGTDESSLPHLGWFNESIYEAIQREHPEILSYLFSVGVGQPHMYIKHAVKYRSLAIFQVFINQGWDINRPLERNVPPALGNVIDDKELTGWFLDHGADPNATCDWDLTPMSRAMLYASMETIQLLFDRGGNAKHGQLLHNAAMRKTPGVLELVKLLLDKGLPINDVQYENHWSSWRVRFPFGLGTPLHYAAQLGNLDLVTLLLSRGADPTIKNSNDRTVSQIAELFKQSKVIELLQKSFAPPA